MEKVLATISDVARLSGMSVSTVSRVINNKPHVSEEKRQKVQAAEDTYVKTDELTDNDTAAPKKDSVIPS